MGPPQLLSVVSQPGSFFQEDLEVQRINANAIPSTGGNTNCNTSENQINLTSPAEFGGQSTYVLAERLRQSELDSERLRAQNAELENLLS